MSKKCPICGTHGRIWNKNPLVFQCPNCSAIYSEFGFVLEPEEEIITFWN